MSLYWESSPGGERHEMRHHNPFSPSGTATFPGHRFLFCGLKNPNDVRKLMIVGDYPDNIYYYDPYHVEGDPEQTEKNLAVLNNEEREKYNQWRKTLSFHEQYLNVTGRSYLANYLRAPPMHHMWPAEYFGQEHWVTTRETHFQQVPPKKELAPVSKKARRKLAPTEPRLLQKYRDPNQEILNMTLKVLSVAPRVFDVPNFLSPAEVEHILELATEIDLHLSITGEADEGEEPADEKGRRTRTSYNSWVQREQSPIIDAVYRRAADLMRIDEALLRTRTKDEYPELENSKSIAEQLQYVACIHCSSSTWFCLS